MTTNTANRQTMNKEQLTKYLGTLLDIDGMNFYLEQGNIYFEVIHLLDTNHDSYVALWN